MLPGKLVNLRLYEMSDLDEVMEWINNQEVRQYLSIIYPISRTQEVDFLQKLCNPTPDNIVLAIETKDKLYLGGVGLHKIDMVNRHSELGIAIGKKEYWGKGYGTDSMMTILDYAFNQLNLHKVYLRVYSNNPRAIRCYEKCGFRKEGVQREHRYRNNKYYDDVLMGILKKEFLKRIK